MEAGKEMLSFRGRSVSKIDAKGRVSVPARFRMVIEAEGHNFVYCYPALSHDHVLDAGGKGLMDEMEDMLAALAPYSDEHESLAHSTIGSCERMSMDSEGRIVIPEQMRKESSFGETVAFIGLGRSFQIWRAEDYDAYRRKARERAARCRGQLRRANGAEERGDDKA